MSDDRFSNVSLRAVLAEASQAAERLPASVAILSDRNRVLEGRAAPRVVPLDAPQVARLNAKIRRTAPTRNAARCLLCGDTIESTHTHDFRTCSCGNVSVDGGPAYRKRVFRGEPGTTWVDVEHPGTGPLIEGGRGLDREGGTEP
jgi:hypothetical protein